MFKKSDLKTGHVAKLRGGGLLVYIEDFVDRSDYRCGLLIDMDNGLNLQITEFNEDLTFVKSNFKVFDVVEILEACYVGDLFGKSVESMLISVCKINKI